MNLDKTIGECLIWLLSCIFAVMNEVQPVYDHHKSVKGVVTTVYVIIIAMMWLGVVSLVYAHI